MIKVDYRETLITYLNSESVEDAARNLNISRGALKARIAEMRKKGVKVPTKQPRGALGSLEVAQLNSLINKHNKENANT